MKVEDAAAPVEHGASRSHVDVRSILRNYGIVFAFLLVCAILATLAPAFRSWTNVLIVTRQASVVGIMAVGMTFVILTGGIDLSVGSILAFSAAVVAGFLKDGMPLGFAVLIGLL